MKPTVAQHEQAPGQPAQLAALALGGEGTVFFAAAARLRRHPQAGGIGDSRNLGGVRPASRRRDDVCVSSSG